MRISEDVWNEMIIPGGGGSEFDWFGVDQNGHLGVFSTSNIGYIPEMVKTSWSRYHELWTEISSLPLRFKARLIIQGKGWYDDWLKYSQQGLIAFDFGDVHRTIKTEVYDLMSIPEKLMGVSELGIKSGLVAEMPQFRLSFNQEKGISELKLKNSIEK